MAGLGTGAAPFRAFLQHRAWLSEQGIKVGPTYYYFGSRHQHQEYLYGEEIETYILDKTITKAGLAFSRDGPKKVYIQHKMLEDAKLLAHELKNKAGVFYLCGPTWPVPDVYEALVGALMKNEDMARESASEFLESLKEEERYVLEVTSLVFARGGLLTFLDRFIEPSGERLETCSSIVKHTLYRRGVEGLAIGSGFVYGIFLTRSAVCYSVDFCSERPLKNRLGCNLHFVSNVFQTNG